MKNKIENLETNTEISRQELVLYAQKWAEKSIEQDQKPREMIDQVIKMGFETSAEFYNKNPNEMDEQEEFAHSLFLESLVLMQKARNELRHSLKELVTKIGGFPSLLEFGPKVVQTAWLIYQHSDDDKEFQKQGLTYMYEIRKQNPENISLVYFYYLTDRITTSLFDYQFFGTQSNGENLVTLPDNLKEYFKKNPTLFCTKLVETELPENLKIPPKNSEMLELWQLAKEDNPTYVQGTEGQNGMVYDFLAKYST
jgi:hypothetical protein